MCEVCGHSTLQSLRVTQHNPNPKFVSRARNAEDVQGMMQNLLRSESQGLPAEDLLQASEGVSPNAKAKAKPNQKAKKGKGKPVEITRLNARQGESESKW